MHRLSRCALAAVLAAVVLAPAAVAGQSYDTPDDAVIIDRTSLLPGGRFTVTGGGFGPGSTVRVVFHSTPVLLGTLTASVTGTASGTFGVPPSATPGRHTVELAGVDPAAAERSITVQVTVLEVASGAGTPATGPSSTRPSNLAFTGAATAVVVTVGALLAAGGAALLRFRRRRVGLD
jgi:hypothetical protein